MNKQSKKIFVTVNILMIICCYCTQVSFARIWGNWRDCVNSNDCTGDSSTSLLGTYILESAGYFLSSHSDYQTFLTQVELSESNCLNYNDLREIIYSTIENMEKSRASYANLKAAAEKIPYNQKIIEQLMKFDYNGFMIRYDLNEPVFMKIKTYLCKGDIPGFDSAILVTFDSILDQLYLIKNSVDKDQLPEISLLWRINQAYAEHHLLGQYLSEVLKAILF